MKEEAIEDGPEAGGPSSWFATLPAMLADRHHST